jgi:hypothetical protein
MCRRYSFAASSNSLSRSKFDLSHQSQLEYFPDRLVRRPVDHMFTPLPKSACPEHSSQQASKFKRIGEQNPPILAVPFDSFQGIGSSGRTDSLVLNNVWPDRGLWC